MQGRGEEEEGEVGAVRKNRGLRSPPSPRREVGSGGRKGAGRARRFLGHVGAWTRGKPWGGAAPGRPGPGSALPVPESSMAMCPGAPTRTTGVGEL